MRIIAKDTLVDTQGVRITKISVASRHIAAKAQPGQFVVLMKDETSERIPLTVVDTDKTAGTVTLIFQELGFSTKRFGMMNTGDSFYAVVGPLGHATDIKRYGNVILVGGGVGIAEILPVARALKKAGNTVTTILGARNKDLLILENELRASSDHFHVTTDDGSYGRKGFTTDVLKELLSKNNYDLIYVVGPVPMMRKAALTTKEFNARTVVSLNTLMVDATGMCGGCRVTVGSEAKFACVDGPEFDAHQVDWDELTKRNRVYDHKEKHLCNLHKK
jgi:ferredoxin--NADP+ reductase